MKKILFIEDEELLQDTVGKVLQDNNYEVIKAMDGQDGLDKAVQIKPDLILLDLVLPKMYGLEVLENLKKKQEVKDIPVIILSNLESIGEIDKAVALGAAAYLIKTQYSLTELVEKVKKIIEEREIK
jgi:DNA-binding response OmpR family regulator